MSSHREAPEISKDPVADNTDTYAFVSPDNPETVTIITNYVPPRRRAGGPTSSSSATTSSTRSTSTTTAMAGPRSPTSSLRDGVRQPEHVPVQHGPDRFARSTPTGTSASSTRSRASTTWAAKCSARTAVPALQHRRPLHAGILRAGRKPFTRSRRRDGVRRAAQRPILRGPRLDLRSWRPAAVPEPAPDPDGGRPRRRRPDAQRPHDRDPGPDRRADRRRLGADRRDERDVRARHLGRGEPAQGADRLPRTARSPSPGRGFRSRGWATRCSTRCSFRWPRRTAGTPASRSTKRNSCRTCSTRSSAKLLPVLYPERVPNLAALTAPRADLEAILLTGLPAGIVPGFQNNTGKVLADMLRLNVAVPPAKEPEPARPDRRRPRRVSERTPASPTTSSRSSCERSPA